MADIFTEIPKTEPQDAPPSINVEEFRKVVHSRRSVRVFDGTPVPEAVIRDCLDLALLAPNSSNLQPWEFHWVRTPWKKQKLIEACLSQPAARTAAELIVCVGRRDTWWRNRDLMLEEFRRQGNRVPRAAVDYYERLVPLMYAQGWFSWLGWWKRLLFFSRGLMKPTPREPVSNAQMDLWSVKSTSLACENLMLALRAHGYDSCPMEGIDSARIRRLLGLPRSASIAMVISAGKRAPNGVYGPQIRFDRSLFIHES